MRPKRLPLPALLAPYAALLLTAALAPDAPAWCAGLVFVAAGMAALMVLSAVFGG